LSRDRIQSPNNVTEKEVIGYLRYDTSKELMIINDLYRDELRLHENFFQPVMELVTKERLGGRIKRKYDTPKNRIRD
jgi:hypothetical protein